MKKIKILFKKLFLYFKKVTNFNCFFIYRILKMNLTKQEIQSAIHRKFLSNCTFAPNEIINYVFARKDFHNKRPTLFNIYTADEEFLVMSATYNQQHKSFNITTNSKQSGSKSIFYVGSLTKIKGDSLFLGRSLYVINSTQSIPKIVVKINYDKISPNGQFSIAKQSCEFKDDGSANPNDIITFNVTEFNITPEHYSFVLSYEGKVIFSLNYKDVDEFSVMITNPLTLFQAFSFCLAFLSKAGCV